MNVDSILGESFFTVSLTDVVRESSTESSISVDDVALDANRETSSERSCREERGVSRLVLSWSSTSHSADETQAKRLTFSFIDELVVETKVELVILLFDLVSRDCRRRATMSLILPQLL